MFARISIAWCLVALSLPFVARAQTETTNAPAETAESATQQNDRMEEVPPEFEGMEVDEHLNNQIPPDLVFFNQNGERVKLGDYFDGKRPVILTLNYYRCPMLCGLTLNGMVDGLKGVDWTMGDQYRILTVSFDPFEQPPLALAKRENYVNYYERPVAEKGWDFLTGSPPGIKKLLDATGFPTRYDDRQKQWIHPACLIVLTPDGHISRYLYGVQFAPQMMRLSLVEASEGKIGTTVDHILLYCFHYDPQERRYSVAAMNLVRAGGGMTAVMLGIVLFFLWRREKKKQAKPAVAVGNGDSADTTG